MSCGAVIDCVLDAANINIVYGENNVEIRAKETIAAKSKLYNFAGEVSTAEYVWKSGVVDHAPTKECTKGSTYDLAQIEPELGFETCLKEGKMEEDPLSEEKLELLQDIGMLVDIFEIEKDADIPNDLLLAVKVLFMDAEEFSLYKSEMIQSGYIMDESEMEPSDSDEEPGPGQDSEPSAKPTSAMEVADVTEADQPSVETKEESEEEVDEGDMQILPEITNEPAVFRALTIMAETKLSVIADGDDSSGIMWDKAGIIRKPSLIATYLKEIERDILTRFVTNCNKHAESLKQKKPEKSSGKRKLSTEAKAPKSKKQKTNK